MDRLREPSNWARWDNAFATALLSDARVEERVLTAPLRDRRPAWRGEARGEGGAQGVSCTASVVGGANVQ